MFFYNLLLIVALIIASPYLLVRFAVDKKWRSGWRQRLGLEIPRPAKPSLWLHAASVGEVKIAAALSRALVKKYPDYTVVLSVVTLTGLNQARQELAGMVEVVLAPLDLPWIVDKFIRSLRPRLIGLVETELWPNLITRAAAQKVKMAVLNGRLSDRSYPRYKNFKGLFKQILPRLDLVCAQTETDAKRFRELGADPAAVRVCSSIKYDLVLTGKYDMAAMRREFSLPASAPVWTCGSTRNGEEEILLPVYAELKREFSDLKLILAPRHLERVAEISRLLEKNNILYMLKSKLGAEPKPYDCLLLDTMGELVKAYAAGTVVFVGGSLVNYGGQNILEPAMLGKPMAFGPSMNNFQEIAGQLIADDAARQVKDSGELLKQLHSWLLRPEEAQAIGDRSSQSAGKKRGAIDKNIGALEGLLS